MQCGTKHYATLMNEYPAVTAVFLRLPHDHQKVCIQIHQYSPSIDQYFNDIVCLCSMSRDLSKVTDQQIDIITDLHDSWPYYQAANSPNSDSANPTLSHGAYMSCRRPLYDSYHRLVRKRSSPWSITWKPLGYLFLFFLVFSWGISIC